MEKANKFAPDPPIPEAWAAVQSIQEPWSQIIARCQDGSYKDVYSLGDTKVCSFSDEGLTLMHIVGIDIDNKADGSGKAPITWMGQYALKTAYKWGSIRTGVYVQDGSPGGYGESLIRPKVEALISKLQPELQDGIVAVTKTYNTMTPQSGSPAPREGVERGDFKIWIPAYHGDLATGEMGPTGQYAKTPKYSNAPVVRPYGESPTEETTSNVWCRDMQGLIDIYIERIRYYRVPYIYIRSGKGFTAYSWEKTYPIVPCFCT